MDRQFLLIGSTVLLLIAGAVGVAVLNSNTGSGLDLGGGDVAIVQLSGSVTPSASSGIGATSDITPDLVRNLNQKATNQGADAIIYEINSGGGAVVASKEVMREVESVDVPTVCRFRDISASGAYLFALGCDRIVADSTTLTGSIGVRSSYFEVSGLMDELGVEYVNITSGEHKDIGSPYRNITDEERRMLQQKADRVHAEFIDLVQERRNLTDEQLEEARTGEPFLGERARNIGLVDKLGGRQTAIDEAENLTGKDLETFNVEQDPSFNLFSLLTAQLSFDQFLSQDRMLRAEY